MQANGLNMPEVKDLHMVSVNLKAHFYVRLAPDTANYEMLHVFWLPTDSNVKLTKRRSLFKVEKTSLR